jgi:hypothetical protein
VKETPGYSRRIASPTAEPIALQAPPTEPPVRVTFFGATCATDVPLAIEMSAIVRAGKSANFLIGPPLGSRRRMRCCSGLAIF